MASITSEIRSNGTQAWHVHSRPSGEKWIHRTFDARSDAEAFKRDEEARIAERRLLRSGPSAKSFYQEKFLHTISLYRQAHPGSHNEIVLRTVEKIFAHEPFASAKIEDLKPNLIASYIDAALKTQSRLGRPIKANTVATHLSAMAGVFRWRSLAYDIDATTEVFTRKSLPKRWAVKRDRRFEEGEEKAIMDELRRRGPRGYCWRLYIKMALDTCARQQELFRSTWDEFHTRKREWNIPAEHSKTGTARSVPLSKRALRMLRVLRVLSKPGDSGPFVALVSLTNIRTTFRQIRMKAGVEGFRFHDLRHEGVSRSVVRNTRMPVAAIMKYVGHSNLQTFYRYANLRGAELADLLD